jgi:hypothetical protein
VRKKAILSGLAIAVLLLAGCSNADQTEAIVDPPTDAATQAAPMPTPTPTPEPAAEVQPLATKVYQIATSEGHIAALTIDWFASQDVAIADLPADCMARAALADQDPTTYHALEIPVRLTVEYPSVNGFVWPADHEVQLAVINHGGSKGPTERMTSCGFPTKPNGGNILMPGPTAGGTAEGSIVFFAQMTPNDPSGAILAPLGETMLSPTGLYSQLYKCAGEPNEYCHFYYPAP